RSGCGVDQAVAVRVRHGLRSAPHPELAEDALDVRRDRLRADHELRRDRALVEAAREKVEDLLLARGQPAAGAAVRAVRSAREMPPHAREELRPLERLDEVVVGADEEAGDEVELLDPASG